MVSNFVECLLANLSNSNEVRLEKKYVFHEVNQHAVDRWIRFFHLNCSNIYEERKVNSVYSDTRDYAAYNENIIGDEKRYKFRIRWYGKGVPDKAYLELKIRSSEMTIKERFPIYDKYFLTKVVNGIVRHGQRDWVSSLSELDGIPYVFASSVRSLIPTALVSYDRNYFLSRDKRLRITSDRNITYSRYGSPFSIKDRQNVMEIKTEKNGVIIPSVIKLRDVPAKISRNSKYVKAISVMAAQQLPFTSEGIY